MQIGPHDSFQPIEGYAILAPRLPKIKLSILPFREFLMPLGYTLRDVQIPTSVSSIYSTNNALKRLTGLSRLNVFIGPNNCGKSWLLRELFSAVVSQQLQFSPISNEAATLEGLRRQLRCVLHFATSDQTHHDELESVIHHLAMPLRQTSGELVDGGKVDQLVKKLTSMKESRASQLRALEKASDFSIGTILTHAERILINSKKIKHQAYKPFAIYIPSIRGLRDLSKSYFYAEQTLHDYFQSTAHIGNSYVPTENNLIWTGEGIYDWIKSYLLGKREQRVKIREYESYLSRTFFDGREVSLIPREDEKKLHVKIGKESERPLCQLGDGIQQTIILTLPLFIQRNTDLVMFIEEPELYLHPGFQRIFIDAVFSPVHSSCQVFVATHSHQFLDITIDRDNCSIYRFHKELNGDGEEVTAKFIVEPASWGDFAVLRELGVRNSSVLLSNCTIWVEGLTDRLYLRRCLEIFLNQSQYSFREDIEYSFVEYGGANVTHWSFLNQDDGIDVDRLCGRLFLIADAPMSQLSDALQKRHEHLQEKLGTRYYRLECGEVENLLTPEVIRRVVSLYKSKDGKDLALGEFDAWEYKGKRLGGFIDAKLKEENFVSRSKSGRFFADEFGAISNKVEFCNKAIELMTQRADISDEAWSICEKLADFVRDHNG